MNKPKVSIIIPAFNSERYLSDTLGSIEKQSFEDWECIIVDDGSSDATSKLLNDFSQQDPRIKPFSRPAFMPKGGNSCRNFGFEQASGEFIQWFDSDDLMEPFMLERKVKALMDDLNLDFVVSKMATLRAGQIEQDEYRIDSPNRVEDFLAYKIYFLTPGPMFRKAFLEEKQLFSTELKRHQEWEFFSRLLIEGCDYLAINEFHCIRRVHDNSIKHVFDKMKSLHRSYYKLFAVDLLNSKTQDKAFTLLSKLFYKRILWAVLMSVRTLDFQYFGFFWSIFFKFTWKNVSQLISKGKI